MNSASLPDTLADRLDQVLPPHSTALPDHVETEVPEVRAAVILARGPHPVLSAEAVARIQTRVISRAAVVYRTSRRWTGYSLRWAAAVGLVVMILAVSTTTVSASSVPGDALYPVKRWMEEGRLAFSSDAGDVTLRLEFAERRLDEFETLLDRGEVNLGTLNDALDEMNSALTLVENGDGPREEAAIRLIDLSARQTQLAVRAVSRVAPDRVKTDKLRQVVDSAGVVQQHAHDLIAPSSEPQASVLDSRDHRHNLGSESTTFIATDISSVPAGASAVPGERFPKTSSESGGLVGSPTPTPEPTATLTPVPTTALPPTDGPSSTATPADRPPMEEPTSTPTVEPTTALPPTEVPSSTPTVEPTTALPPTEVPSSTPSPDDRPPMEEPVSTPTVEPTTALPPTEEPVSPPTVEPTTALPPTEEPVSPPTPEPTTALPPTEEPVSPPTVEPTTALPPTEEPVSPPTVEPATALPPTEEPVSPPAVEPATALPPTEESVSPPAVEPTTLPPTEEPVSPPAVEPTTALPPVIFAPFCENFLKFL